MTENIKEKRAQLKALSSLAKEMVKIGEAETVNDGLLKIYELEGHKEVNSYKGWQKLGFQVKKGTKALLLWGEPKRKQDKPNQPETAKENCDDDGSNFWPLAYVFSNLHVEPIKS